MENKRFLIVIGAMVALLIGVVAYTKITEPPEATSNGSNNVYGKLDSKVTLTEFVDFQCEACYAFYPTVKEVKEQYKDRVKFQIKNFPISSSHKFSRMAASYAESAARQGKFFEMHDKIFEGQKLWETSQEPQTYFDSYGVEIGLDKEKLKQDVSSSSVSATINADLKEVKRLGGDGTPTFALNGKKIENPQNTVEAFTKLLDNALKEAESN